MTARDDPQWQRLAALALPSPTTVPYITVTWWPHDGEHLTALFDEVDRLRAQVVQWRTLALNLHTAVDALNTEDNPVLWESGPVNDALYAIDRALDDRSAT